jgi:hypothetical protein
MANFPKSLINARKQVKKNGTYLAFERRNLSGYAPESDTPILPNASTTWSAWTLILPFNDKTASEFDEGILEGTTRAKTRFALITPDGLGDGTERPQANDLITYEGAQWILLGANVLSFQGVDILYKAVLKRP